MPLLYGAIYAFRDIGHTQGTLIPFAKRSMKTQGSRWIDLDFLKRIFLKFTLQATIRGMPDVDR